VLLEKGNNHESGYKTWNIVDNQGPAIKNFKVSNIKSRSFTLTASAIDSATGIERYEFYINGELQKIISTTDGTVNCDITEDISPETTYNAQVIVYDTNGRSTSSEITFTTRLDPEAVKFASVVGLEIGDYVDYDAGVWDSSVDTAKIISSGGSVSWSSDLTYTANQFEGFVNGQSRNTNSTVCYKSLDMVNVATGLPNSGWRVWSIDDETVTLISAGCPETYTSSTSDKAFDESLLQERDCSMYVNEYAVSARLLTYSEMYNWNNQNSNISDSNLIRLNADYLMPEGFGDGELWWYFSAYYVFEYAGYSSSGRNSSINYFKC